MTQQITLPEPRTVTRLVYEMALQRATTDGARQELLAALQWYELKWQAVDRQRQEAAAQVGAGEG